MSETAYYIDQFTDEVMPCGTSLDAWASWLSEPDPDWGRETAAKNGEVFLADVYEFHQVSAVRQNGKWNLSPDAPPNTEWMVVRYGDGKGWNADDICCDIEGLRQWLDGSMQCHPDAGYFVACAVRKPAVKLLYQNGRLRIQQ